MNEQALTDERAERRRTILEAAIEIFAAHGFVNARTREIARVAGVGEGTIYLYFEGKDDLLLTAFREKVSEFCDSVSTLLAAPIPFEQRLQRFVAMQLSGIEADPDLATVILLESRQSTRFYREPVREVLREYSTAVERLITSGLLEGSVRPDLDVPLARRMLIGSLEEIALDWLLGQRTRPLAASSPEIARIFHAGIRGRTDG
ncbi:MAG: TetR family transcriptional regulator [Gemmatimonas sp.]|nr:TetR family transcriptional regulator [Gemmatimonas sp.]